MDLRGKHGTNTLISHTHTHTQTCMQWKQRTVTVILMQHIIQHECDNKYGPLSFLLCRVLLLLCIVTGAILNGISLVRFVLTLSPVT